MAHGLSAQPRDLKPLDNSRIQTLSNTPHTLSKRPMYICIIDTRLTEKANKDFQATISTEFILLYPCCSSFSLYKAALANHIFVVKAREVSQSPSSVNNAFFSAPSCPAAKEKNKRKIHLCFQTCSLSGRRAGGNADSSANSVIRAVETCYLFLVRPAKFRNEIMATCPHVKWCNVAAIQVENKNLEVPKQAAQTALIWARLPRPQP